MKTSEQTLIYNALDAATTLQCRDAFFVELNDGFKDTYNHTIDLYEPLMYMMVRGIKVDREKLQEVDTRIAKRLAELEIEITEKCGRWVNPNSPKAVANYFYIEKGISAYTKYNPKTKKSAVTTDDKALQRIARGTSARKGFYEAKLMQEYRKLRKLKGTYLEIQFDEDSRLRCSFNPRGTKFGRISSSKTLFETGMNLQNLPPAFNGFMVADDDMIFISMDKRQAEWVVVAYESGDRSMINAIETGVDPHAYTASQMFKVPVEYIISEHKVLEHDSDPDSIARKRGYMPFMAPYLEQWLPRTMSIRQCGKKSNHGLNYDERASRFALENEITEKEAGVVIDMYHGVYPGIKNQYYTRIQSQLREGRTLTNCFGRKCRFLDKWNDELFKQAYSFLPQSTVGELVNRGIIKIYHSDEPSLEDYQMLRQVHDSVDGQMPDNNPVKIAMAVRCMEEYLNPILTAGGREYQIKSDLKIGYSMDRMIEIDLNCEPEELADKIRTTICELKKSE